MVCLLLFLGLMSAISFWQMKDDKERAQKRGVRRIPERTLFLTAIFGGAIGGWLAMWMFRHKTKHWYFKFGFMALAVLQLGLLIVLWARFGTPVSPSF